MMTSMKIKDDLWRAIKVLAIDRRVSMAHIVNEALEQYLKMTHTKRSMSHRKEGK